MLLQNQIFGREIVFVGNRASAQPEPLGCFESIGRFYQVAGQSAGEKVAWRTGRGETDQGQQRNVRLPHPMVLAN